MTAAAFLAGFSRRFGCTLNLIAGREFDRAGDLHAGGASCATCHGCDETHGDVGLACAGVALVREHASLRLSWSCPKCGHTVSEDTTLLSSASHASSVASDPLCHRCRIKLPIQ